MRQSILFTRTKREAPKDEEAVNAKLLVRAGFTDKVMAGVYSFLPLGLRVLRKIETIIREEMISIGGQEILLPTLQPKANWTQTGRWESYDSLFRFTSHYSEIDYVLGPTHEEMVSPLLAKFISSYRDLPRAVFQIQNKFRDEKRVKSGLLRGREFLMKDLYSFHADAEDLDRYYEVVQESYRKIFSRIGIGDRTFLTFASGGTFSKYSHEFQTVTEAGEDTIHICAHCNIAVNQEIIEEQRVCPSCGKADLEEGRAAEVGNIFKLQTRYSEPFALTYKDKEGDERPVLMGCYGIGITRLVGVLVETFHDDQGILWPEAVAPFRAHLINLRKDAAPADRLYESLSADGRATADGQNRGIEVLYDDRTDASAGEKFADADLIGIPWRLVVGEKTGDKIEVKRRDEKDAKLVSEEDLFTLLR